MSEAELYQWHKPDSFAHTLELARMVCYIGPVIWSLKLYDKHWASKFRHQPDIHELARRARGESPRDAPIPLPRIRKRTLTNPLPPIESLQSMSHSIRRSRQRTDDQAACAFLMRLPFEIRQDIYEDILAGGDARLVHILRKHGTLGHWRCRIQDGGPEICDSEGLRCVEGWLSFKVRLWHLDREGMVDLKTDSGLLPLLLTCRAIYSEAIRTLYAKNIFHFYDPGDIRFFGRTILPQRLNTVQSIMMDWERPFSIFNKDNTVPKMNKEELFAWTQTWSIIKNMEGLQHLKVILKRHKYEVSNARRVRMCKPMMEVRGLRTFELVIPWDNNEDWEFAANAPFKIVRASERLDE